MNRLLMSESPFLAKVKNNKRALQVLQASASDKDLLVSPNLMSGKGKKSQISQKKAEGFQDELLSKENTPVVPTVRRSKRKNVALQEEAKKTTSKEGTETKVSSTRASKASKSKKVSTRKGKKQSSVDPKQSKMDSFIASSSTSNTIFESNLENDGSSDINDIQLRKSENSVQSADSPKHILNSDASFQDSKDSGIVVTPNMLTSDKPPGEYWEILAEERRIALERALYENEMLHDQVEVLETDNSQLRDLLKIAENMATLLKKALEE